jgi:hypothetical protein
MNFMKKKIQPKKRQRQRVTQRSLVIATVFLLSISTLGLMLFIQIRYPEKAGAKSNPEMKAVLVKDQQLITEKSLDAPVLVSQPATNAQTIFVRSAQQALNTQTQQ